MADRSEYRAWNLHCIRYLRKKDPKKESNLRWPCFDGAGPDLPVNRRRSGPTAGGGGDGESRKPDDDETGYDPGDQPRLLHMFLLRPVM
jgi:hypothetical protein